MMHGPQNIKKEHI